MSRDDSTRLGEIVTACEIIADYLARDGVDPDLAFDAIRMRLVEIGEAVHGLESATRKREPSVPWKEISHIRSRVLHRYSAKSRDVVLETARTEVPVLRAAAERLLGSL
ncbi:uncharacterized protein with HEPN domain [Frondihabitans sp. PhB188]|uniref:HepT-like ribonuclease domain-containing protein n=1 Tax=Frondihabitans sp. PhB188 TaxID=2485200 RepID=UPI000F48F3D5|nr:HepT-like ribonuclease domain-containing protein [Frondihabitans sp. PhB188]ROQ39720.1 uncharacterized protein with HEPN domain [Frondihabitans sp. PhB188]